jgi:N-acetylmuramoyl-L-alanine amidase
MKKYNLHLLAIILFSLLVLSPAYGDQTGTLRVVVIDPGHGGMDPGAVSGGVQEKDLVLDIALRLGKKIRETYPEVKVIYTRDKDIFIPLYQRADIANRSKADLFISLHANYVSTTTVGGTETFTLGLHRSQENLEVARKENAVILLEDDYSANYEGFNPKESESYIMFENMQSEYQEQSIDFAAKIQDQFSQNLRLNNRGVKQAGFLVLRRASMPSVLVEVGFISNPTERKFMLSEEGKSKITQSVFEAFKSYKKTIESRSNFALLTDNEIKTETHNLPSNGSTKDSSNPESKVSDSQPGSVDAKPAEKPSTTKEALNNPGTTRWYAVQIAATQKVIDTNPSNFKNEKSITRLKVGNINKYVSGKYDNFASAVKERNRLRSKFPDAFVVVVENGIPSLARN